MIDSLLQDIKEGVLMQNRAIKYRIYPSAEQKILFPKRLDAAGRSGT